MSPIKRRRFIQGALGAAAGLGAGAMIGPKSWAGANDTLRIACIGLNGRGRDHVAAFSEAPGVEVAALCDVDESVLARAARLLQSGAGKTAKTVTDLRRVLDDKTIDAVSIATPHHWHALAAIWACQAGKDVYVETPGCHNIFEGGQVARAARKYGRLVHVGAQSRTSPSVIEGIERLARGAIGTVYMAKAICCVRRPSIGALAPGRSGTIPAGVDYNLWLGPAEKRPLGRENLHHDWHWFWDFGHGELGYAGIHSLDLARWGLGVGWPDKIHATGGRFVSRDAKQTPDTLTATFEFSEPRKMIVAEVHPSVGNCPDHFSSSAPQGGAAPEASSGVIFYGSEGTMVFPGNRSYRIDGPASEKPHSRAAAPHNPFLNFARAVKSRKLDGPGLSIDEGRVSAGLCILANVSYRLGRGLEFDGRTERVSKDKAAEKLLRRRYRKPFVVPERV